MSTTECAICCKSSSQIIYCDDCKEGACLKCTQIFLLGTDDAQCMHCRVGWDEMVLRAKFSSSWVEKKYKDHKKKVLLELEKSYMAETMPAVILYKKFMKLKKQKESYQYETVHAEIERIQAHLEALRPTMSETEFDAETYRHQVRLLQLQKRVNKHIRNHVHAKEAEMEYLSEVSNTVIEEGRSVFTYPCIAQGCKGFLDKDFVCGCCNIHVCKDCRVEKKPGHVCKESDKESVSLIEKETKACPTCHERIYRPSGCDHMFCTMCHASFSWKTGKCISESQSTNPLFFKWKAEQKTPVPIPMGDFTERDLWSAENAVALLTQLNLFANPDIFNIDELMTSISAAQIQTMLWNVQSVIAELTPDENIPYGPSHNRHHRVRFIVGEINETDFLRLVAKKYKEYQYNKQHINLKGALRNALIDWIGKIIHTAATYETLLNVNLLQIHKELFEEPMKHIDLFNKRSSKLAQHFVYKTYAGYQTVEMTRHSDIAVSWERKRLPI